MRTNATLNKITGCLAGLSLLFAGCGQSGQQQEGASGEKDSLQEGGFSIEMKNRSEAGIYAPKGFKAKVFADTIGEARNLAVKPSNGDVYAKLDSRVNGHCMVAMRDANGDGKADSIAYFSNACGNGSAVFHNGYLYHSTDSTVLRTAFASQEELVPSGKTEIIAKGFEYHSQHRNKNLAFDGKGNMFVTVGAPSNACMKEMRTPGSEGMDPCPILEKFGGVWQFDADKTNQDQMGDGKRYATGIRNMVAVGYNTQADNLYGVQHGRDQMHQFFPDMYSQKEAAMLPAEEMFKIDKEDHFGWPYCYYDGQKDKKVLGPEYGGNGDSVGRCSQYEDPIAHFPAHYAPNDLMFYDGSMFPEKYKNGAFIAFHGSWNRHGEHDQWGFDVVFVPFDGDTPSGQWQTFAEKFEGVEPVSSPGEARYRPCGLGQGNDGSLYVSDDTKGRIWKLTYEKAAS